MDSPWTPHLSIGSGWLLSNASSLALPNSRSPSLPPSFRVLSSSGSAPAHKFSVANYSSLRRGRGRCPLTTLSVTTRATTRDPGLHCGLSGGRSLRFGTMGRIRRTKNLGLENNISRALALALLGTPLLFAALVCCRSRGDYLKGQKREVIQDFNAAGPGELTVQAGLNQVSSDAYLDRRRTGVPWVPARCYRQDAWG